ncbi:MAG: hypothetical protein A3C36_05005 [Omnitrophica WOR_2 bacterium RIFCSPHIGHO2_02_FULL_52_10]|nr:MAG: hypothetical protein A3C36_05005 [Omnitrophica WOR_2 bacterium RIFCSPHIGHO2_02_FULL_52_10]
MNVPVCAEDQAPIKKKSDGIFTNAVVKVFVTKNEMDYYRPWQSKGIAASSGSGAIITGNRILTNAHVVSDHTFIQVKKDADPRKYSAQVVAIGHDCDLALLSVDDPDFFKGTTALEFGVLPSQQDSVTVIGYPEGGEVISITEGVVSRIEVTAYTQSSRELLTVQIDAAINAGNSGGPVIQNGKLVGVAMQVFLAAQNIGYMIPTPIIGHFLKDLDDGTYNGFPTLGIAFKNTENATMRKYYGIDKIEGGVLISKVLPYSPASGYLQEGDILLNIDNVLIGEDGTFPFRGEERLSLTHLITDKQINDTIDLTIIRDGKDRNVQVRINPFVTLVPHPNHFEKPPYYIFGGLVFTVLSTDLIYSWGDMWWEKAPLDLAYYAIGTGSLNEQKRKEVVVLLDVLPDDINVGYHEVGKDVVTKVNGRDIKSFRDLVTVINEVKTSEEYTILETEHASRIILNNKGIEEVNSEILKRNNIPYQYSDDVAGWINGAR